MNTKLPNKITLFEVGPRDGLQNESAFVSTNVKIAWIHKMIAAGLSHIELTSFVSPKWVPALADHAQIMREFAKAPIKSFALTPNGKGAENAIASGCQHLSVITAVSESFTQKNTHCSISESLVRIENITKMAKKHKLFVRAYISCTLGCPYEGFIAPNKTATIAKQLHDLGCNEIVISDTIGTGTPNKTQAVIGEISKHVPINKLAVHFHDTYGQALANVFAALQMGITTIDAASAGLGGCPYAKGASGNVATEDVIYLLNGLGIETNVNLDQLINASEFILSHLKQSTRSKTAQALQSKCQKN